MRACWCVCVCVKSSAAWSYLPGVAVQLKASAKRHLVCHAYIRGCEWARGLEGDRGGSTKSVITNYQEEPRWRSLSLLLLAAANRLPANRDQRSARSLSLLSLLGALLLPGRTTVLGFSVTSRRQEKENGSMNFFIAKFWYLRISRKKKKQQKNPTFFFYSLNRYDFPPLFFPVMARLAVCGLTETWCFRS